MFHLWPQERCQLHPNKMDYQMETRTVRKRETRAYQIVPVFMELKDELVEETTNTIKQVKLGIGTFYQNKTFLRDWIHNLWGLA